MKINKINRSVSSLLSISVLILATSACKILNPPTPTSIPAPIITSTVQSSACQYILPYASSEGEIQVSQGNSNTGGSHSPGSYLEYAFDFDLEQGDLVLPARHGWVEAIHDGETECGDNNFKNKANFVIIRHGDGTYAQYLHLQKGILVEPDQEVWPNQTILGYVGNTGWTNCTNSAGGGYHLHFQVSSGPEVDSQSIPVCFMEVSGDGVPIQGEYYISQNGAVLGMTVEPKNTPTIPAPTSTPTPIPQPVSYVIEVPGNVIWLDTNIIVTKGQRLTFSASGTANTYGGNPGSYTEPSGSIYICPSVDPPNEPDCLINGEPYGKLVGRIGNGTPFAIGTLFSITASASGNLYLAINDNEPYFEDNSGSYHVWISIK